MERLFHYNQILVSTCFNQARAGTVGSQPEHYLEWKDTSPVAKGSGGGSPRCGGIEQPANAGGRNVAPGLPARHHSQLYPLPANRRQNRQSRHPLPAIPGRPEGDCPPPARADRAQHGDSDQRGGIIWHTQGSGKSLTMVFWCVKCRTLPELRRFKVVVVTDRTDLEKQLSDTAVLTGEPLQKAKNVKKLEDCLKQPGAGLVFGMIQKFKGGEDSEEEEKIEPMPKNLNPSEDIFMLIDEAHRSHASTLHTNLLTALPNL